MNKYQFTIIATGLNPESDDFEDMFFEAGCGDATLSFQKGLIIIEFNRFAEDLKKAVITAYNDVRSTSATIDRVEPDHLVNISDIAERSGMTKQAVSLYALGKRSGDFPSPTACVTSNHPLWDWYEVAVWLHERNKLGVDAVMNAKVVRDANDILDSGDHNKFEEMLLAA